MSSPLTIFKAITHPSTIENLVDRLFEQKAAVHLRDKQDRIVSLQPDRKLENQKIQCLVLAEALTHVKSGDRLTASFVVDHENYMFETSPQIEADTVLLNIPNLFHLQKRSRFRYVIPLNYPVQFTLTAINQKACGYQGRLLDLSTEGCGIEISLENASLSIEDTVQAKISLGQGQAFAVQGIVKNIRIKEDTHLVLGVSFPFRPNDEHAIVSALAEMQRDLHLRKSS